MDGDVGCGMRDGDGEIGMWCSSMHEWQSVIRQ